MRMKVAHAVIVSPNRCGLYETTRELVFAERALGLDARLVDPKPMKEYAHLEEDRGVPIAGMDWGAGADLVVSHSGHDGTPLAETSQPIVHVAHGRPLSTFLGERDGGAPGYSYNVRRSQHSRYRCAVTFWPEYEPIFRTLWREKPVHVVTPPVDASYWSPGLTSYDFGGKAAAINVVMTDPWSRRDVSPFHAVHAFARFAQLVPGARLHLYAVDGNTKGIDAMRMLLGASMGVVQGWASDLRSVYRAADLLITPHRIYTRSIREAMACGCQVVSGRDEHPENVEEFARRMALVLEQPAPTRELAVALFSPARAAQQMAGILRGAVEVAA